MQKFYISDADATIQKLQNQLNQAQITINEQNATINSQHVIISSQRSQIEQLQSVLSEPPVVTYNDYPLCMYYNSIKLATQVNWSVLSLYYKYDSGSHFWWLSCGTSQIQYQYDKVWHINKESSRYFTLAYIIGVNVSHADTDVSDNHLMVYSPSKVFYTECYTDEPFLFIPITILQGSVRVISINAAGDIHTEHVSTDELTSHTFPIFLPSTNLRESIESH